MCVFKSCNDRMIAVFSECPTGMWNISLINNLNQKFLFLLFPPPQSMAKFSCWRHTCERRLSLLSVSPQQLPSSVGFHCYCPHLSHLPLPRHKSLGSAHRDHSRVCKEPSLTTRLTQWSTHVTHTMTDRQTPGSNMQRVAPRQFSTSRCICQIIALPSHCTCGPSLLQLFLEREGAQAESCHSPSPVLYTRRLSGLPVYFLSYKFLTYISSPQYKQLFRCVSFVCCCILWFMSWMHFLFALKWCIAVVSRLFLNFWALSDPPTMALGITAP